MRLRRFALFGSVTSFLGALALIAGSGGADANPQDNLQSVQGVADLTVSAAHAQLGQPCQPNGPLIVVTATIANVGSAPSTAQSDAVTAREPNGPLSGSAALPQINPGSSANVTVMLYGQATQFAGQHTLVVTVNDQRTIPEANFNNNSSAPLTVFVPAGGCQATPRPVPTPTSSPISRKPDLAIRAATVRLASFCHAGFPVMKVLASIVNSGGDYRASVHRNDTIVASDASLPNLRGSMGLPALANGQPINVSFLMYAPASELHSVSGIRSVLISINKNKAIDEDNTANNTFGPVAVRIPSGFCSPPSHGWVRSNRELYPGIADLNQYSRHHILATAPPQLHVMGPCPAGDCTTPKPTSSPPPPPGGTPPPSTPSPGPGGLVDYVSPPGNLRQTLDPTVCGAHSSVFGSLFCPGAIKDPAKVVLVWEWPGEIFCPEGKSCIKLIDGYMLYKSSGSGFAKVATIDDRDQKARAINLLGGTCYVARAYSKSLESNNSNEFCVPPTRDQPVKTMILSARNLRSFQTWERDLADHWYCSYWMPGGLGGEPPTPPDVAPSVEIGNGHSWDPGTDPFPCSELRWHQSRAAVSFTLDSFKGRFVDKAVMSFKLADPPHCASSLLIATDEWRTKPYTSDYLPPGDFFEVIPGTLSGDRFAVDVTKAVRDWLNYGNNMGFVLRSEREGPFKETTHCWGVYSDFKLQVDYFTGP